MFTKQLLARKQLLLRRAQITESKIATFLPSANPFQEFVCSGDQFVYSLQI